MASNLDRLKAKKAANQKKEADLSTSFTIDEVDSSGAATQEIKGDKSSQAMPEATESAVIKDSVTPQKPEKEKTQVVEANKPNNQNKAIKPINNINPIIPNNTIKKEDLGPERNLGLRLASAEDKRYLDLSPLSRGVTKKSFFISLMENEFESVETININDPEIEKFRNTSLKTTAITISVPESLIEQIKAYAAKHMMKYQRYIAYVINKSRVNDEEWGKLNS